MTSPPFANKIASAGPVASNALQDASPRRRVVSAATLVVGAGVLAWSLRLPPGDALFYPGTLLLALTWIGGARLSGPLPPRHRRTGESRLRVLAEALAAGLILVTIFLVGAVVVSLVPALATPVQEFLDHARKGNLLLVAAITAANGLAEELFFRGALFAALPRRWQLAGTTVAYTVVTALSGVPLLALAALLLGVVVVLQRRATSGLLASVVTHLVWSLGMLLLLGPTLSTASRLMH